MKTPDKSSYDFRVDYDDQLFEVVETISGILLKKYGIEIKVLDTDNDIPSLFYKIEGPAVEKKDGI